MLNKGYFITFEGADGSGKTTQIEKIAKYFDNNGIEYVLTRDPGGTELGNNLRNILLNHPGHVAPLCEMFLYLADRAQHIEEKILPALEQNIIVLCDRHIDSTVAYQGYARGLDIEQIKMLNKIATKSKLPDLTILFDVDTDIAMQRVGDTKDRLESEAKSFHQQVRNGYLELAKQNPDRIKVIDTNRCIEEIYSDSIEVIKNLIGE